MYLLYFVLWIIFNGAVTTEICIFGLVIAGVIFAFTCRFMDYSVKKEKRLYRRIFKMLRYIFVLVREIIKANFAVIHMILSEKEEVEPALVSFHTDMKNTGRKSVPGQCDHAYAGDDHSDARRPGIPGALSRRKSCSGHGFVSTCRFIKRYGKAGRGGINLWERESSDWIRRIRRCLLRHLFFLQ